MTSGKIVGAGVGALAGGGEDAVIGGAVGAGARAVIGHYKDKQEADLNTSMSGETTA